jgi:hypothetical protein
MRYKKVERIVTVEFVEMPGHPDYDIRITPEELIVRYGDTLVWDVQGLPPSRAEKIAFGSFELVVAYPAVSFGKKGFAAARPKDIPKEDIPVKQNAKGQYRAKHDLGRANPGIYKYDIKSDGKSLVDPDVEVRGPKY